MLHSDLVTCHAILGILRGSFGLGVRISMVILDKERKIDKVGGMVG